MHEQLVLPNEMLQFLRFVENLENKRKTSCLGAGDVRGGIAQILLTCMQGYHLELHTHATITFNLYMQGLK